MSEAGSDESGDWRTNLSVVVVLFGLLIVVPSVVAGYDAQAVKAEPDIDYELDPGTTDATRFGNLSTRSQEFTRPLVEAADNRSVQVQANTLPEPYLTAYGRREDPTTNGTVHVLYQNRVYRVSLVPPTTDQPGGRGKENVTVTATLVENAYYEYDALSAEAQRIVDRLQNDEDARLEAYGPLPPEFATARNNLRYEVGENVFYVNDEGTVYTVAVSTPIEVLEGITDLYLLPVFVGGVLTSLGAMALATSRTDLRIRIVAVVGALPVFVPMLVVRMPYLLTPVGSPARYTVLVAVLSAIPVAAFVGVSLWRRR